MTRPILNRIGICMFGVALGLAILAAAFARAVGTL